MSKTSLRSSVLEDNTVCPDSGAHAPAETASSPDTSPASTGLSSEIRAKLAKAVSPLEHLRCQLHAIPTDNRNVKSFLQFIIDNHYQEARLPIRIYRKEHDLLSHAEKFKLSFSLKKMGVKIIEGEKFVTVVFAKSQSDPDDVDPQGDAEKMIRHADWTTFRHPPAYPGVPKSGSFLTQAQVIKLKGPFIVAQSAGRGFSGVIGEKVRYFPKPPKKSETSSGNATNDPLPDAYAQLIESKTADLVVVQLERGGGLSLIPTNALYYEGEVS